MVMVLPSLGGLEVAAGRRWQQQPMNSAELNYTTPTFVGLSYSPHSRQLKYCGVFLNNCVAHSKAFR